METILDRLELTEKEYGSRPAVDDGSVCLTYTELVTKARGIGAILSGKISLKQPVAILAEKSTATLSCMYGVVYAGGFYVSVNPEQPPERIRKILDVLESKIVVVDEARRDQLTASGYTGEVLYLEQLYAEAGEISEEAAARLSEIRGQIKGEDPLYGVFTLRSSELPVRTSSETRLLLILTYLSRTCIPQCSPERKSFSFPENSSARLRGFWTIYAIRM